MIINPKVTLYLYFDAKQTEIHNRIVNMQNRLFRSRATDFSIDDLLELRDLMIHYDVLCKAYEELYRLFNSVP